MGTQVNTKPDMNTKQKLYNIYFDYQDCKPPQYLGTTNNLNKWLKQNNENNDYKDQNKNGKIAFIHGSTQLLVSSVYDVKPEVGDLFIFPSYMMHTVYPFFSDEERRSISFNAFIDEEAAKF